jgi:hypothetical protein
MLGLSLTTLQPGRMHFHDLQHDPRDFRVLQDEVPVPALADPRLVDLVFRRAGLELQIAWSGTRVMVTGWREMGRWGSMRTRVR